MISVLRIALGPRVKLASCKSALKSPVVYSTDPSKAVVPVLILLYSTWPFVLVFFSPFSIAITSLGEERANLSAFRTFIGFVWFCLFPHPLCYWEGLRLVIVALPRGAGGGGGGRRGGRGGRGKGNLGIILVRVCKPVFRNLSQSYTRSSEIMIHSYTAR